jgi:hypothetical protein
MTMNAEKRIRQDLKELYGIETEKETENTELETTDFNPFYPQIIDDDSEIPCSQSLQDVIDHEEMVAKFAIL